MEMERWGGGRSRKTVVPRTRLNCIPFPSCCEASPARPRRGSSSPRPFAAGFESGMPVADAIDARFAVVKCPSRT